MALTGNPFVKVCSIFCSILFIASVLPLRGAEDELEVVRIQPYGEDVAPNTQVVIEFNRPVVPLGEMSRSAADVPVEISPALECEWRWLNRQALSCLFSEGKTLQLATKYQLTIHGELRSSDGLTLGDQETHEFVTRLPKVTSLYFREWLSPGRPSFNMMFDQPVTKVSLESRIAFVDLETNVPESPKVRLEPVLRYNTRFFEKDSEGEWQTMQIRERDQAYIESLELPDSFATKSWIVTLEEDLSLDTEFEMRILPGLASIHGSQSAREHIPVTSVVTFPEFEFIGLRCENIERKSVDLTPETENLNALENRCNPRSRVSLIFSAPVKPTEVAEKVSFDPSLSGTRDDYDPWEWSRTRWYSNHRDKPRNYYVRLPVLLKGDQHYVIEQKDAGLIESLKRIFDIGSLTPIEDEFGRPIKNAVEMEFWTRHRDAEARTIHEESVLESSVNSRIPIYVTNLEAMTTDYFATTEGEAEKSEIRTQRRQLPEVVDISYAVPLGVRELLGGKSGAVFGDFRGVARFDTSKPTGNDFEPFFAQVTPYNVHLKVGHFNSVAWITDMATGDPVENARIAVFHTMQDAFDQDSPVESAQSDSEGIALLPGQLDLHPEVSYRHTRACVSDSLIVKFTNCRMAVLRVDSKEGMAILPLTRRYDLTTYPFRLPRVTYTSRRSKGDHIRTWGTTAQGVYRKGETVQYKIYVRDQDASGLIPPEASNYQLKVYDPSGKVIQTRDDIRTNAFGAFHGLVKIPENALMGWYWFIVEQPHNVLGEALRVLVTDFTPAPVRVENRLNATEFHRGAQLKATTNATLFSGGPYRNAPTQVTVNLVRDSFRPGNPALQDYIFAEFHEVQRPYKTLVARVQGVLSNTAEHEMATDLDFRDYAFANLSIESVVRDDRGRSVATESRAKYFGVDRFVGMKRPPRSYLESEDAEINVIVVDVGGNPVGDTRVEVELQQSQRISARVRSAGNAYIPRHTSTWNTIEVCEGFAPKESMICRFSLPAAGSYRAVASIEDTQGIQHATMQQFYVRGSQYVVWKDRPDYQLKLIPQHEDLQVGENAQYLVENPFPQARALVTVERYGILDQWVTTLDSSTAMIEFPIKPDYVPGVYVSVVVISPRVADPPVSESDPQTDLDLGKPSFRMGYATLPITDPYKQLKVETHPNREVFKPGDVVQVDLRAQPEKETGDPEPIEFAVAVLDESVLDLLEGGTSKFDPYDGFYSLEPLDMANFTLLHRLMGVQEFAKKGASPGGDGGGSLKLRSIEKFVGYWNPSLKADESGLAKFEFTLPDNLTGWRILALAVTPSDRFGLGVGRFETNQPTELRQALPNQVTERDEFLAEFTVLNRTDRDRTLRVQVDAKGNVDDTYKPLDRTLNLGAQQRTNVGLPIRVANVKNTRDSIEGQIEFEVKAWDESDGDALRISIPVLKKRSIQVATNFGHLEQEYVSEPIQIPDEIYEDVGDIEVNLNASLVGELSGAIDYLFRYPYACWEQRLSRAVGYAQQLDLKSYLTSHEPSEKLRERISELLESAVDFQASNGGMAYWLPRSEYVSPYLSAYTALAFQWLRERGHEIEPRMENSLHQYLQEFLREDRSTAYYTQRTLATVRAVALHALARAGKADASTLFRFESHIAKMSVFGLAHFLEAASRLPGTDDLIGEVVRIMLMRSNRTSGRLLFSEESDTSLAYIHGSHQRTNCAGLSAFTGLLSDENPHVLKRDVTGLAREASHMRGTRGHWDSTQDNVFCLMAMSDYAKLLETQIPDMKVAVALNLPSLRDAIDLGESSWKGFEDSHFTSVTPLSLGYSGQRATIEIRRQGVGPVYYQTKLSYAPKAESTNRVNAGMDIRREYSIWRDNEWKLLKHSEREKLHKGDLVRVDLFISSPANRHFVVVDDAVPAGLEPLNFDLANTPDVAKANLYSDESYWHTAKDWQNYGRRWFGYSFYFKELGHRNVRFHADYLRAGRHHVVWFGQVVSKGSFSVAPTHVEEMYSPDVYAKSLPWAIEVE